jgi:hypothetical protein
MSTVNTLGQKRGRHQLVFPANKGPRAFCTLSPKIPSFIQSHLSKIEGDQISCRLRCNEDQKRTAAARLQKKLAGIGCAELILDQ